MEQPKSSSTIFINPKFKNVIINPSFLKNPPNATQIHLNPKFLQQQVSQASSANQQQHSLVRAPAVVVNSNAAIIKNTKRSLIRAPTIIENTDGKVAPPLAATEQSKKKLIKISNTKLIKASHLMKYQQKENESIKNATESLLKSKKLKNSESIYKLDRRKQGSGSILTKKISSASSPKKSSSSKLQKTSSNQKKLLVIQGQKFVLDPSGMKLERDKEKSADVSLPYIVYEGKTFKKTLSSDSYERYNSANLATSHVAQAKTKSISLLHRTSSKTLNNTICPIYRRIGKCLAYAKGKCSKVHDPRYVMVCSNFVRGSCKNDKCLLSHNANLHKMPVCKYYLQGICLKPKNECLYLHKKLSDGTKLCSEFLKGYCPMADKCNLLHEHIEGDRKKYSFVRSRTTAAPKKKKKPETACRPLALTSQSTEPRYFESTTPSPSVQQNIPIFRKTAPFLPDFIKL